MTDNVVIKPLSSKKSASLGIKDDGEGFPRFRKPKIWEVDENATGDSWCD